HVMEYPNHQGMAATVKALNNLYKTEPALYQKQFDSSGFEWIDGGNADDSIVVYARKGYDAADDVVVVLNMTPVTRHDYRVGVTAGGGWKEIFNSDAKEFWGSGVTNYGNLNAEYIGWHGRDNSIKITIPPLGAAVFKRI
ncbi:MAG: alpha amylase C-terminal domain-containing protein, partial [Mucilaginibacter sp.]